MDSISRQKKHIYYYLSIKLVPKVPTIISNVNIQLIIAVSDLVSFPHSLLGVVQSFENLTPRGLANSFSSNDEEFFSHSLDSFLLSKRRDEF